MKKYLNLQDIRNDIDNGILNCVDLVNGYIANIKESDNLNIFLEVFEDSALRKAKEVDEKIKQGTAGKLAGMVISIKDNICYKGHKVTASSKILEGFESLYSSTVVDKILKEDGIIIGRTNCDEFAMGSSNENSFYGNVKNPLDEDLTPGGSSGGAASSVAANLCLLALGSDTGGSIRQPASFTGTIGLKPTYGMVSRHGLIAYASSFDQIGPIANSIEDINLILNVISGKDEYDSTLSKFSEYDYLELVNDVPRMKIAFLDCYLNHSGINPEVKAKTEEVIASLKSMGHKVEMVDFDLLDQLVPTYYVITTAEASSNLARYDGIHFGYRSKNAFDLESTYLKSRSEGFGPEVKRRIMLGTYVLSAGYYDAYFTKAQKVRRLVRKRTKEILKEYDFIISPTTPHPAFELGSQNQDPIKMYLEDIFTVQANLAGNPAISLPIGKTKAGLPFGIQLMADDFKEKSLLDFSHNLINNFALKKA